MAVPDSPWRRIAATAVVVGGSLVAAGVLGTVVGWAIVTGNGRCAAVATVTAVTTVAVAWPTAKWVARRDAEQAQVDAERQRRASEPPMAPDVIRSRRWS